MESRFVAWVLVIGALMAGGFGVSLGAWWGYYVWQWRAFVREQEAIEAAVDSWRDNPPARIDRHTWREVVGTAYNAVGNVCFSPDHVSLDEMRRLRAEVEAKSRGPITMETLDWMWWRLGRTGPHGAKHVTQMLPLWEEAREWVLPAAGATSEDQAHQRFPPPLLRERAGGSD